MKAQDVIQAYLQAEKDKQENDLREQEKIVREAKAILVESSYIWLNGLMDDFVLSEPPETKAHLATWPHSFSVSLHFSWQGVPGMIIMYWRSDNKYNLNRPVLIFEFGNIMRRVEENSYQHNYTLDLPANHGTFGRFFYGSPAGPVDFADLGEFLVRVQYEIDRRAELDRRDAIAFRERRIANLKNAFMNSSRKSIEDNFKVCMSEYPEMGDEWEKLFAESMARLDTQAKLVAEWEAERERLENEAQAEFEPCVIYRVKYGARDENDGAYTEIAFTLDHEPDADGWYHVIYLGQISRAKLPNIIRIDEFIFRTFNDVPNDWWTGPFEKGALHSEKFEELTVAYWSVPPEVKRLPKPEEDITPTERRLRAVTGC